MHINEVELVGRMVEEWTLDHICNEEEFYTTIVELRRDSDVSDFIPVICCKNGTQIDNGNKKSYRSIIQVNGQYRSYNITDENGTHLKLFVFAKDIQIPEYPVRCNKIELQGTICSPVILRKTPKGKIVADVLLAVNRAYGKTDYIPCICWGRTANKISSYKVGTEITVYGRIQSRQYTKNGNSKIAYEVSVSSFK